MVPFSPEDKIFDPEYNAAKAYESIGKPQPQLSRLAIRRIIRAKRKEGFPTMRNGTSAALRALRYAWLLVALPAAAQQSAYVYVTNSAETKTHVIDVKTNKVVQVIRGIERPHGVQFSPDGAKVYISNEGESVVNVIDQKTGQTTAKIALSGRPNNISISRDGRKLFVAIAERPGGLDILDLVALKRSKTVDAGGTLHNVYTTPDGKYAVMGSTGNRFFAVVDAATDQLAWKIDYDKAVRPMAFERNADGSTKRVFVGLSDLHGFAVIDFAQRKEVSRVELPHEPGGFPEIEAPSHAIGVTPDNRELWVSSTGNNSMFAYTLPDLKLKGRVGLPEVQLPAGSPMPKLGASPNWLSFSPDSKTVYVSNGGLRSLSVIDAVNMKLVTSVPVGETPKRINTLAMR
jgi:YVTN family beta-propeller protein